MSLWRKIVFSAPERRTPSIIELWLSASEMIRQFGRSWAIVEIAARLETQPDVKASDGLLAMQVGEFGLEPHQRMVRAGNVARAAGARAMAAGGLRHRVDHVRVHAHRRGNRWSTRSRRRGRCRARRRGPRDARWRSENGRRRAQGPRTRGSGVRRGGGPAPARNTACSSSSSRPRLRRGRAESPAGAGTVEKYPACLELS